MKDIDLKVTLLSRPLPSLGGNGVKISPIGPVDSIQNYIRSYLEESGHYVAQADKDQPLIIEPEGVLFIIGGANWYPKIFRQLKTIPKEKRPLAVIWHTEPLPPPKKARLPWPRLNIREIGKILLRDDRVTDPYSNYFRLRHLYKNKLIDLLVVPSKIHHEFLMEKDIPSFRAPLGYEPSYGRDLGLSRNIDALFLGALNIPRRKKLIKHLRRRGVNLTTIGSWFDPDCWGDNRTRLLNRTKIFLNFLRFPGELSGFRLNLGMANKALVISEPIYKPDPYIPGKHYISASAEEMPDVINHYLSHPEERERIVNEGHWFVTQELTMKKSVSHIMDLIKQHATSSAKGNIS